MEVVKNVAITWCLNSKVSCKREEAEVPCNCRRDPVKEQTRIVQELLVFKMTSSRSVILSLFSVLVVLFCVMYSTPAEANYLLQVLRADPEYPGLKYQTCWVTFICCFSASTTRQQRCHVVRSRDTVESIANRSAFATSAARTDERTRPSVTYAGLSSVRAGKFESSRRSRVRVSTARRHNI